MLHEGARGLEDVAGHLREDKAVAQAAPTGSAAFAERGHAGSTRAGRRLGRDEAGIKALVKVNRRLLGMGPGAGAAGPTLDIDATSGVVCEAGAPRRTYLGARWVHADAGPYRGDGRPGGGVRVQGRERVAGGRQCGVYRDLCGGVAGRGCR